QDEAVVRLVQQVAAADASDAADDEDHGHDHGGPGCGKPDVLLEVRNHVDLKSGVYGKSTCQIACEQPELLGAKHRAEREPGIRPTWRAAGRAFRGVVRRVAVRAQTVGLRPVADQHAEQRDTAQDEDAVADKEDAPAVRLHNLRVQYDDGRAEDGARYCKARGQTAVATEPSRDDHGPSDPVADAGCPQGNDHKEEEKPDDAGDGAEADEADG